jgi:hypothetical protein
LSVAPDTIAVTSLFPQAEFNSFTIVRNLVARCLESRYRVTDVLGDCALQIHIGAPDETQRHLFDHRLTPLLFFAFVETPTIPNRWVTTLNAMDAVAVPSLFCRDVLERSGVTRPIHHVPLGIDLNGLPPLGPDRRGSRFTIMWQGGHQCDHYPNGEPYDGDRKCGYLVEQAWRQAAIPNSRLILKSIPRTFPGSDQRSGDVIRVERVLTPAEISLLDREADLFVWPTRGEGFGLPPLEKLGQGLPVLVTGWSGPLDYLYEFPDSQIEDFSLIDVNYNHVMTKVAHVDISVLVERIRWAHANLHRLRARRDTLAEQARTKWDYRRSMTAPLLECVSAVLDSSANSRPRQVQHAPPPQRRHISTVATAPKELTEAV